MSTAPPPASPRASQPGVAAQYLQVFANRRIAAMLLLGLASGLPLALSAGTLQAWLTVAGINLQTIGYFALVGLPYTFKFVWAPLLDRFEPRWRGATSGRRKAWLMVIQLCLGAACVLMASLDPKTSIDAIAACAVLIAFLSASQDVVFDAYRNDLLDPHERGAGAAVSVLGYRLAMLASGGLALILADRYIGWSAMYQVMGVLFVVLAVATLWVPAVVLQQPPQRSDARRELLGFVAMVVTGAAVYGVLYSLPWSAWLGPSAANSFVALGINTASMMAALLAAIYAARRVGFPSFVAPWDAFFQRRHALALLALIVLYKLGDAFAGALSSTFLIRGVGFSAAEVGEINKALGLVATIVGALIGGAWLARRPLFGALMWFGILQAVSNFGYWLLAVTPPSSWQVISEHLHRFVSPGFGGQYLVDAHGVGYLMMAGVITLENLCGGMGTAAFVTLLMSLTDRRYTAAQYALLSALSAVGRVYVGPASGVLVQEFGWPTFFVLTVAAALPGLLLLAVLRSTITRLAEENRPGDGRTAPIDD